MKKGDWIAVRRNDQYVGGYIIAKFNRIKDGKIHYQKRRKKPNQKADYYQELDGDNHPRPNAWRDATGELVPYSQIEATNTYQAITED